VATSSGPELDLGVLGSEDLRGTPGDLVDLVLELPPAEQVCGEVGEKRRLALALLGGRRPPPRPAASSLTTTAVVR
jgi:hypothetical protein